MKRRFLILCILLGSVWVLAPEPRPVLAVCDCYDTYSACLSEAVATYENCVYPAEAAYNECMSTIGIEGICSASYWSAVSSCESALSNSEYSCDQSLTSCLAACQQGGGGGSVGSLCHWDEQMGYITSYVSWFSEPIPSCILDGGSVFTGYGWPRDTFDSCMTNTGGTNQELCCRAQVEALLNTYAICSLNPHNPGCKHCITF